MKPTQIPARVVSRIRSRTTVCDNGCWVTDYSTGSHGYAQVGWVESGKRTVALVHRVAYVAAKGEIPEGMTVDHTCKTRKCCNPDHLRLLNNYENARRTANRDWPLGSCVNGHPNSELHRQPGGKRVCAPCKKEWQQRYLDKKRSIGIVLSPA